MSQVAKCEMHFQGDSRNGQQELAHVHLQQTSCPIPSLQAVSESRLQGHPPEYVQL